ncbi:hypothetical protein ACFQ48_14010 [Hymenobacter caeli]
MIPRKIESCAELAADFSTGVFTAEDAEGFAEESQKLFFCDSSAKPSASSAVKTT